MEKQTIADGGSARFDLIGELSLSNEPIPKNGNLREKSWTRRENGSTESSVYVDFATQIP